jgi:hypothetical protein
MSIWYSFEHKVPVVQNQFVAKVLVRNLIKDFILERRDIDVSFIVISYLLRVELEDPGLEDWVKHLGVRPQELG